MFLDLLLYIPIRLKYNIMANTTLSAVECKKSHAKEVKRIMNYFMEHGVDVSFSKYEGYEYLVGKMRCIINAHQNIPANKTKAGKEAVVIELANDKYTLMDKGYDTILYIDTTNWKRDKFYIIDVAKAYPAIMEGLAKKPTVLPNGRSYKHFFPHRNNDVISNSGFRVGISEVIFADLPGVELINL